MMISLGKVLNRTMLRFATYSTTYTCERINLEHDVPVTVLQGDDFDKVVEPDHGVADAMVFLPAISKLKGAVDRSGQVASLLTLGANQQGSLFVKGHGWEEDVTTSFRDLQQPHFQSPRRTRPKQQVIYEDSEDEVEDFLCIPTAPPTRSPSDMHVVTLDSRVLARFLTCVRTELTSVAAVHVGKGAVLHLYGAIKEQAGGVMTVSVKGSPARVTRCSSSSSPTCTGLLSFHSYFFSCMTFVFLYFHLSTSLSLFPLSSGVLLVPTSITPLMPSSFLLLPSSSLPLLRRRFAPADWAHPSGPHEARARHRHERMVLP